MKKRLIIVTIILTVLLATSILSHHEDCEYDPGFDKDNDYIMNKHADCGHDYQHDCDDNNKDIFKDCRHSFWSRLFGFFTGAKDGHSNRISGNTVKTSIQEDCAVTICMNKDLEEIYCPLSYQECSDSYSDCRIVECDEDYCEVEEDCEVEETKSETYYESDDDTTYYDETEYESATYDDSCDYEYHDCYDNNEAVICKGDFELCAESFEDCTCGTEDDVSHDDQAKPDEEITGNIECDTGVFVCDRQVLTMSNDIAESTVTCKSSFQECSVLYGNCRCGESSLTDFPTLNIGTAGGNASETANNYWCDYKDRQVPCYMLPEDCDKTKNTCKKSSSSDMWITCEGSFEFCEKKYPECLCGIEIKNSGFMKTSSD
jgi:hypothetical protein